MKTINGTKMFLMGTTVCGALAVAAIFPAFAQSDPSNDPTVTPQAVSQKSMVAPAPESLMVYDLNNDGVLSMEEVGERLFYRFDRDGNEVIDNTEWTAPINVSYAPMEKVTVIMRDTDGDGQYDSETVDANIFEARTGLDRFDDDADGLSAHEFTGHSLLELDLDDSGVIELSEFRRAYEESRAPLAAKNEIYNDGE